jgi:hypothetical protein
MSEPPEVTVVGGSPTDEEEQAAREAIVQLWREARAVDARGAVASGWMVAARAEATKRGALIGRRHPQGWRLSGRLRAMQATPTQTGRGDAK